MQLCNLMDIILKARDSVSHLIALLQKGINVALVIFANDPYKYEDRLRIVFENLVSRRLKPEFLECLFVMVGGWCWCWCWC